MANPPCPLWGRGLRVSYAEIAESITSSNIRVCGNLLLLLQVGTQTNSVQGPRHDIRIGQKRVIKKLDPSQPNSKGQRASLHQ